MQFTCYNHVLICLSFYTKCIAMTHHTHTRTHSHEQTHFFLSFFSPPHYDSEESAELGESRQQLSEPKCLHQRKRPVRQRQHRVLRAGESSSEPELLGDWLSCLWSQWKRRGKTLTGQFNRLQNESIGLWAEKRRRYPKALQCDVSLCQ